jgi:hypothetical protein
MFACVHGSDVLAFTAKAGVLLSSRLAARIPDEIFMINGGIVEIIKVFGFYGNYTGNKKNLKFEI